MSQAQAAIDHVQKNVGDLKPFILISGRVEHDDENTTVVVYEASGDIGRAKRLFIRNLMQDVDLEEDQSYDDITVYWEFVQPLSLMLDPNLFLLTEDDVSDLDWEPNNIGDQVYAPGIGGF